MVIKVFKYLCGILTFLVFTACNTNPVPSEVERILENTTNGKNLAKVLRNYSNPKDSLRFKAACFLIQNLPAKGYLAGQKIENLNHFFPLAANQFKENPDVTEKELENLWDSVQTENNSEEIIVRWDLDEIDPQFLIDAINHSFMQWENQPFYPISTQKIQV